MNKELGIFRNMMHHAALNYELSGANASTKNVNKAIGKSLAKVTSGSVTRVTDLSTLVGTNAIPVDYLIITHSSLFNNSYLTTLANWRRDHNGYDVVICQVDASGSNNDIYDFEDTPGHIKYPSTSTTRYVSIRNFVSDVYVNGRADHTGDGHLGYICLVGDALQDDNSTIMLPAANPAYYGTLEKGGDYYYACTGGDSDNIQDVMYGRISVGNATELNNVVSKIIAYESDSNGSWCNDYTFVSFSPDLWSYSDPAISDMTNLIPSTIQKSYLYRTLNTSSTSQVTEVSSIFARRFTNELWSDPNSTCYSQELNDSLYDHPLQGINNGIHTFIYEGHGGWNALGANEGSGRYIFRTSEIGSRLSNNLYSFMIFNCCESGYLDQPERSLDTCTVEPTGRF